MKNKYTLYIHIGAPKTGTSALQRFLYDNQNSLNVYGYAYPDLLAMMSEMGIQINVDSSEKCKNGCVLSRFVKDVNRYIIDTTLPGWNELCEILDSELEKNNVIVSEESIWWWNTESIIKAFKERFDNIKIIVYLRRQDRYIEADWNQRVKRYGFCSDTFQTDIVKRKNNPIFQYKNKLDLIESFVGLQNIIVRVFEKGQFCGCGKDITSDFLNILGIEKNDVHWNPVTVQNESLFGNYIEIKRNLNTVLVKNEESSRKLENIFLEYLNKKPKSEVKNVEGFYTSEQRKNVIESFRDENAQIARKFLNRSNGKIFYVEDEIPEYHIDEQTMHADIIKIFGTICNEQQKKIRELEQQKIQTLLLHKGSRKLSFFGAGQMCRDILRNYRVPVDIILDNNVKESGNIYGIPVVNASEIDEWKKLFIIVTCRDSETIQQQLQEKGLYEYENYILATQFFG